MKTKKHFLNLAALMFFSLSAEAQSLNGYEWDTIQKPGSVSEIKNVVQNDIYGIERKKNAQKIIDFLEDKNVFGLAENFLATIVKDVTYNGLGSNINIPINTGISLNAFIGMKIMHPKELTYTQRNASFMHKDVGPLITKDADKTLCDEPVLPNGNYKFCTLKVINEWERSNNFATVNGGYWVRRATGFSFGLGMENVSIPIAATGVNVVIGGGVKSDLVVETEMFYRNAKDFVTQGIYVKLPSTPEKALKLGEGSVVRFHKMGSVKMALGVNYGVGEFAKVFANIGVLVGLEVNGIITTEFTRKSDGYVDLKTKLFDKKNYSANLLFSSGVKIPISTVFGNSFSGPLTGVGSMMPLGGGFNLLKFGIEKIITSENLSVFEINLNNKNTHSAYVKAVSGDNSELLKIANEGEGVIVRDNFQSRDSKISGSFNVLGLGIISESGIKTVNDEMRKTNSTVHYDNVTTNFITLKTIQSEGVIYKTENMSSKVFMNYSLDIGKNATAKEMHSYLSFMFAVNKDAYRNVPKQVFDCFKTAKREVENGNDELLSNGAISKLQLKFHLQLNEEELLNVKKIITYESVLNAYNKVTNMKDNNPEATVEMLLNTFAKIFENTNDKEVFAANISEALSGKHENSELAAKVLFAMSDADYKVSEFYILKNEKPKK